MIEEKKNNGGSKQISDLEGFCGELACRIKQLSQHY